MSAPQASIAGSVRTAAKPAIATSWTSAEATSTSRTRKRRRMLGDSSSIVMVSADTTPVTRPAVAWSWVAAVTVSGRTGSAMPYANVPSAPASMSRRSCGESTRCRADDTGVKYPRPAGGAEVQPLPVRRL